MSWTPARLQTGPTSPGTASGSPFRLRAGPPNTPAPTSIYFAIWEIRLLDLGIKVGVGGEGLAAVTLPSFRVPGEAALPPAAAAGRDASEAGGRAARAGAEA